MRIVKQWFAKAGPVPKILMVISIASMLAVGNMYYIKPYFRRQRYQRAEDWANMVIEQEENLQNSDESYLK